ncbi:MAG TPA: SAM-dependent methyltransferase [Candidatus Sulfotelmatobacter sp.]|nr:SAM-dependent methyltransferase [Candidatus Sulfotelmatobacter sp.]
MRARIAPTPLAEILKGRIRSAGPITFAEYMEACLYHPDFGYYSRPDFPPRRDYFTSVDVSPVFGRLLARQFDQMWRLLGKPGEFVIAEAGAGSGALARQILDCAHESLGEFAEALRYLAIESSAARRSGHARVLEKHFARGRVESREDLPEAISCGCIFSNELLDAFPVHRVLGRQGELREIYVSVGDEGFCEEAKPLSKPALADYFRKQGIALQDEQQAEAGPAACDWIARAGRILQKGFVLTIDYGHEARELYDDRHIRGTLLAYAGHRASEDFYRAPGEQDLTAHVNFTALDLWGRAGGLERAGFTSQTNFLLSLARRSGFSDVDFEGKDEPGQTRARLLFKTLIHPEGMGETFQVFAQRKGIEACTLAGFEPL